MTQSCSLFRELLFPSVSEVAVVRVEAAGSVVRVEARATVDGADCPGCGTRSSRVHGSYLRFPERFILVGVFGCGLGGWPVWGG